MARPMVAHMAEATDGCYMADAKELRRQAERALRLAKGMSGNDASAQLRRYAAELLAHAKELE